MLLALGSNGSGQLGLCHHDDVYIPTAVDLLSSTTPILSVAAGGNHTLILSQNGNVHVSGAAGLDHGKGKLGSAGSICSEQHFVELPDVNDATGQRWRLCAATWTASFLVNENSKVFSFGTGNRGELGLGDDVTEANSPTLIPDFPPPGLDILDLQASMGHAVAVLSDGSVWGWGSGRKGQLGEHAGLFWSPRRIEELPFKVEKVACGRDFTTLFGAPDDGECLVLGSDKHGLRSKKPTSVTGWKQVAATWCSAFVLKDTGGLVAWGRDDHGQLGPANLPPLDRIAAGSEHVLAITGAQEVLAWGWGEHGNCGTPTGQFGDVKGRFNLLQVPGRSRYIAAGCATSWIDCEVQPPSGR